MGGKGSWVLKSSVPLLQVGAGGIFLAWVGSSLRLGRGSPTSPRHPPPLPSFATPRFLVPGGAGGADIIKTKQNQKQNSELIQTYM